MKRNIALVLVCLTLIGGPAMASGAKRTADTTCSSTSSCLPNIRMVPTSKDGSVYRVRFVEVVGADQRRWTAGPWFTLEGAQRAAGRLSDSSGVPDKSIKIQVNSGTGWQDYAN